MARKLRARWVLVVDVMPDKLAAGCVAAYLNLKARARPQLIGQGELPRVLTKDARGS